MACLVISFAPAAAVGAMIQSHHRILRRNNLVKIFQVHSNATGRLKNMCPETAHKCFCSSTGTEFKTANETQA